jgi:hypothetical protein
VQRLGLGLHDAAICSRVRRWRFRSRMRQEVVEVAVVVPDDLA